MLANLASFSACLALAAAAVPSYAGYNTVWSDDFNGAAGARVNSAKWNYATPAPNDGEAQQYTTSTANARLSGSGSVQLIPLKDGSGRWTSARLETVQTFQSQVGYKLRVEAQIRMGSNSASSQQGIWPAFWALGASMRSGTPWPSCGEWDIFESINGQSKAYTTLHCDKYPGGICNEPVGISSNFGYSPTSTHTWRMEIDRKTFQNFADWPKQTITWYLDGQQVHQITGAQIGDYNTWINVSRKPFYLITNVAVGGPFPGAPNSATQGGLNSGMTLNYVAVYKTQ